jgi:integrase
VATLISKKRKKGTQWYIVENQKVGDTLKREYIASLGYITKAEAKIHLAKHLTSSKKVISGKVKYSYVSDQFFPYYKSLIGREIQKRTYQIACEQRKNISLFLNDVFVKDITSDTLEQFKSDLMAKTKLSNRSINMHMVTVKKVLRYAIRKSWMAELPQVRSLPENYLDKEIEFLSKDQVQTILKHADGNQAFYITLLIFTGLRPKEMTELQWKHINLEKEHLDVYSSNSLKRGRRIPLNQTTLNLLIQRKRKSKSDTVSPYSASRYASEKMGKLTKASGVKFTPYTLRRTFGSWLVQNGVGLLEVAELMGHRNIETTRKHYARLIDDNLKSAIGKLDLIL